MHNGWESVRVKVMQFFVLLIAYVKRSFFQFEYRVEYPFQGSECHNLNGYGTNSSWESVLENHTENFNLIWPLDLDIIIILIIFFIIII